MTQPGANRYPKHCRRTVGRRPAKSIIVQNGPRAHSSIFIRRPAGGPPIFSRIAFRALYGASVGRQDQTKDVYRPVVFTTSTSSVPQQNSATNIPWFGTQSFQRRPSNNEDAQHGTGPHLNLLHDSVLRYEMTLCTILSRTRVKSCDCSAIVTRKSSLS